MRLLLDTHSLIWWLLNDPRLSRRAFAYVSDPEHDIVVSAATAWEIATKHRIGKLPEAASLVHDFTLHVAREGFAMMDLTVAHAMRAGRLPGVHRNPFDRMLAGQSLEENLPLVSGDQVFDDLGASRLW